MLVLNAVLVLAIVLEISKGIELMLRKGHRIAIQQFLEDLTLRVSYIDVKEVSNQISNPAIQAVFTMITAWQFGIFMVLVLIIQRSTEQYPRQIFIMQLAAIAISAVTLLFAWRWPLPQLIGWVVREKVWLTKTRAYAVLLAGYLLLGAGVFASSRLMMFFEPALRRFGFTEDGIFMLALLPLWPVATIMWLVFQSVALLSQLKSRLGRFLISKYLAIFRGVLWRVVEYEKGSVAAIALLLAIALGIAKVLTGK
jgi:hypothetical protein